MNNTVYIPKTWQSVPFEEWFYNIQQRLKQMRYEN